jgi:hypothetical protein
MKMPPQAAARDAWERLICIRPCPVKRCAEGIFQRGSRGESNRRIDRRFAPLLTFVNQTGNAKIAGENLAKATAGFLMGDHANSSVGKSSYEM